MSNKGVRIERGIHELYSEDPAKADWELWGRVADPITRRGFIKKSGLLAMIGILQAEIPFANFMPEGLIPAQLAHADEPFRIPGKVPGLIVLNDRPVNAETPPCLLDDAITPADKMFVRNNGIPPRNIDPKSWQLTIDGESVERKTTFSIGELKKRFMAYTYQIQVECAGNGRNEFLPRVKGNQWSLGAVACPEWTGVRLKDVLNHVGIRDDAIYTAYYGADTHLSGDPNKVAISRGVPILKAMQDESLIAWAINGEDIPLMNGYPLRVITGGWPGSTCGKWLTKLMVRNRIHDGPKMSGYSYRVPCDPVAPGAKVSEEDMCIIESMPVKSLTTNPRSGTKTRFGNKLRVRGHAWAGDDEVTEMHVSIDFGTTWQKCSLNPPRNRLAWQQWNTDITFPTQGYYEVWARATDNKKRVQPMVVPGWNPKGYLNNACQRIAVTVA